MEKYTLHTMQANKLIELLKKSTYNEYFVIKNRISLSVLECPIAEIDCSDSEIQGEELQLHLINLFKMFDSFIKISM